MQKNRSFSTQIANHLIRLGAFGYDFTNPTLWASGTYNPPYVDNRKLLSDLAARKDLGNALLSLIEDKEKVDYIYGIPTAGIGPAALLASKIDKPLLIKTDGRYYSIDIRKAKQFVNITMRGYPQIPDVVVGTIPLGIIFGLLIAEEKEKNFLFVREKPKDHGLKSQIEGILDTSKNILLVDPLWVYCPRYTDKAISVFQNLNMKILGSWEFEIKSLILPVNDVIGKNIVVIEDLISTGESSLKEILALKNEGANVTPRSTFSYDLPSAVKNFEAEGLKNEAAIVFTELLTELTWQTNLGEDGPKLLNWHQNQPFWGDNNGWPSENKK